MKTITAGNSVIGKRPVQQDRYGLIQINNELLIMVVADGNGGEGGGDLAEYGIKTVISKLGWEISQGNISQGNSKITSSDLDILGNETMLNCTDQVKGYKESHTEWTEAGTTITLILATSQTIGAFWIGDSPAYLYQTGSLIKLTSPVHTLAEMLIAGGQSKETIERQPGLNSILTKCVGHDACEPDSKLIDISGPFIIMAGSDGVFGYVSEAEIIKEIQERYSSFDSQEFSGHIIQKSLDNGSDDNCTLIASMILPSFIPIHKRRRITQLCEWHKE